jgi:hypothetical protein
MLRITIEDGELWDEEKEEFRQGPVIGVIDLEHSLISLSKWESKFQKPFLSPGKKTTEELFGYVQAMVITPDVDLNLIHQCSQQNINMIQEYIDSPQSATTFGRMPERRGPSEVITSELIYYWMVAFNIPFECETWHLNRLFSLIRICNIKNSKPTKMPKHEIAMRNRELNAQRRKQLNTTG